MGVRCTATCHSLPLSTRSRFGPSCAPATGPRPEVLSMRSRKSFLRRVNVAPKRRSLCVPIAAFVARRLWLGAKLNNQSSIIVWEWLATAAYGTCWRKNFARVRESAILCGGERARLNATHAARWSTCTGAAHLCSR